MKNSIFTITMLSLLFFVVSCFKQEPRNSEDYLLIRHQNEPLLIDFRFLIDSRGQILHEDSSKNVMSNLDYIGDLYLRDDCTYHCITQSIVTIPSTLRMQHKLWICTDSSAVGEYIFNRKEELPIKTDGRESLIFSSSEGQYFWQMDIDLPKYIYGPNDFGTMQAGNMVYFF